MKRWLIQRWCDYWGPRKHRALLNVAENQQAIFQYLIREGQKTSFGREHHFEKIKNYADFCERVPLRSYENLVPYIERIQKGELDVLWPGRPMYFTESSGTAKGAHKFIPNSKATLMYQIESVRDALVSYIHRKQAAHLLDHKWLPLTGDTKINQSGLIPSGRISSIGVRHTPLYLRSRYVINRSIYEISDFKTRLNAIADAVLRHGISSLGAVPFWGHHFFRILQEKTGKKYIKDILPHLKLYVHGGTPFAPYRKEFFSYIGGPLDTMEMYAASEGYIGYQDTEDVQKDGLHLLTNRGTFYEFIPIDSYRSGRPKRCMLPDVEIGQSYAMVMSTASGLWGHLIGDEVRFVSLRPCRIQIVGRTEQTITLLGEHMVASDVDNAMAAALGACSEVRVKEFSVTPRVGEEKKTRRLEFWVEFSAPPKNMKKFEEALNSKLKEEHSFYKGLFNNGFVEALRVHSLKSGTFASYMEKKGKFEGQSKPPRLSNEAALADFFHPYCLRHQAT